LEKNSTLKYRRVLLKISGEAIGGEKSVFNLETVERIAEEIGQLQRMGVQIGLVIGGGNIIRGEKFAELGLNRNQSDYMGMLATVINGMLFENILIKKGVHSVLQSAIHVENITERVALKKTASHLDEKTVVIFTGGTGNPFFTTDSAAALRACEIGAEVLLKATKVDGVYDKDPVVYPDARFYPLISYDDVLKNKLKVIDMTAVSMCRDNRIPIIIFNLSKYGNIKKIVTGNLTGTLIKE
jgi:uridylate kinase